MKAVVIKAQAQPGTPVESQVECVRNWPEVSPPGAGEVTLRVLASALNQMDLWVTRGVPGLQLTYPRVSGCDVCAEVESIGAGVDPAWVGRRVIVNAARTIARPVRPDDPPASTYVCDMQLQGEHFNGFHAERAVAPVSNLAVVGDDADPRAAAAFGLTFLTAWSMMFTKGGLRPGQSVLITGIGGGVALAALAIAKWMACPVCVTSRHQWKLDKAKGLGAAFGVLDTGEEWSRAVRDWTRGRGVDMAVDSNGKPSHLSCIKSLARGGAYVTPGNTGGPQATTDLARIFWNQLRVLGSTMGTTDELRELAALFQAGLLRPVVDSTYRWDQAPQAWKKLAAGEQFGKIVLDWS